MMETHRNERKKLENMMLGIDFGETNIGVAFGRNGLVSPLKVLPGKNQQNAIMEIARLARENHAEKIIVGLPLSGSGKETAMSLKTRKFAKLLKILTKKPVEFYSEHLSTIQAVEEAISTGISQKKRTSVDHLSAALILKRYYDQSQ